MCAPCLAEGLRRTDEQSDGCRKEIAADDPADREVEAGESAVVVCSDGDLVADDELSVLRRLDLREHRFERRRDGAAARARGDQGVRSGRVDDKRALDLAVVDHAASGRRAVDHLSVERAAVDGVKFVGDLLIHAVRCALIGDDRDFDVSRSRLMEGGDVAEDEAHLQQEHADEQRGHHLGCAVLHEQIVVVVFVVGGAVVWCGVCRMRSGHEES